jgi:fused signal recognition particle receptor
LLLENPHSQTKNIDETKKPYVIMVVGVNGVGKTTTIGKLANQFKSQGLKVVLGAGDTFRAAAVDQLVIWSERVGVPIVKQNMGSDPASVAFDTVQSAVAQNADVVIIDTAGRLHNKINLMNELSKIKRVMQKVLPEAPHEVLLVLDGSTGQNAFEQAKQFTAATEVTALAVTKLDGTAKGGVVIGISDQFQIPVKYIGVGEFFVLLKSVAIVRGAWMIPNVVMAIPFMIFGIWTAYTVIYKKYSWAIAILGVVLIIITRYYEYDWVYFLQNKYGN